MSGANCGYLFGVHGHLSWMGVGRWDRFELVTLTAAPWRTWCVLNCLL